MSPAWKYLSFALLFPYLVSFEPDDSTRASYSDLRVGIGGGQFVYSDCSGSSTHRFVEAGASITHKFRGPFRAGIAVAYMADDASTPLSDIPMIYPDLALDFNYVSLGTTGVRIGRPDQAYVSLGIAEQAPLYTGRGFLSYGVGINIPRGVLSHIWIGGNGYPYQEDGFVLQPEFRLSQTSFLFVTGRYGTANSMPEYGVSVGVRVRRF